jgi:hypothetical protein
MEELSLAGMGYHVQEHPWCCKNCKHSDGIVSNAVDAVMLCTQSCDREEVEINGLCDYWEEKMA